MCFARRHKVVRLMRIQAEDHLSHPIRRAGDDASDARIAVLDRCRKFAHLKGRAHAPVLGVRHSAVEHESLGAAADSTVECFYAKVAVARGR